MRRWLILTPFVLLMLLAVAGGAVQLLLTTDYPRDKVVGLLQERLGLRVSADSLATNWLGQTTLRRVSLSLPLAQDSFLDVPELHVSHTNLIWLILARNLHINSLAFDRPRLVVRQDPMGRWNVQEAMALVGRASGSKAAGAPGGGPSAPPQLPELTVKAGTVLLLDKSGQQATLSPLSAHGVATNPLEWDLTVEIPDQLTVHGRIAPGMGWRQEVEFSVGRLAEALAPWVDLSRMPVHVSGTWNGQASEGSVSGTLSLRRANIGHAQLAGTLDVDWKGGQGTLRPTGLAFASPRIPGGSIFVSGGTLSVAKSRFTVEGVNVGLLGGTGQISGWVDSQPLSADLHATWADLRAPAEVVHRGRADILLQTPWQPQGQPRRTQLQIVADSAGQSRWGSWQTDVAISAAGTSIQSMEGGIKLPHFAWRGRPRDFELADVGAALSLTKGTAVLTGLRWGDGNRLAGWGQIALADPARPWYLKVDLHDVPLPNGAVGAIWLDTWGDRQQVSLRDVYVRGANVVAWAAGDYVFERPSPLDAYVDVHIGSPDPQREHFIGGRLHGTGHAIGVLRPFDKLNVSLQGELFGEKARFGHRSLDEVAVQIDGGINPSFAWLKSQELMLMGGVWRLGGRFDYDTDIANLAISAHGLSLWALNDLFHTPPNLEGRVYTDDLVFAFPHFSAPRRALEQMTMHGTWEVRDFRRYAATEERALPVGKAPAGVWHQIQNSALTADRITGEIDYGRKGGGVVGFRRIVARKGESQANGAAEWRLGENRVKWRGTAAGWPVDVPALGAQLLVAAHAGDMETEYGGGQRPRWLGNVGLESDLVVSSAPLGSFKTKLDFGGRTLDVNKLHAEVLGGQVDADGSVQVDRPLESSATVAWTGLDAAALAPAWPRLAGLGGRYSGTAQLGRATDPHAPAPLGLDVRLSANGGQYNGLRIGDGEAIAYMDGEHFLLDRSRLNLAGGQVRGWARFTHPKDELFAHVGLELDKLDLDQIVHAVSPREKPVPGQLSGTVTVWGPPTNHSLIQGQSELRLTKSNLVNNSVVAALFDAMHMRSGQRMPEGRGRATVRLESDVAHVINLRYFDRGTQLRASGTINNVWLGTNSPISGYAAATARPLRGINFPVLSDLDKILAALQNQLVTAQIGGTLREMRPQIIPFADISGELKRFLVGDIQQEVQGTAGQ